MSTLTKRFFLKHPSLTDTEAGKRTLEVCEQKHYLKIISHMNIGYLQRVKPSGERLFLGGPDITMAYLYTWANERKRKIVSLSPEFGTIGSQQGTVGIYFTHA